MPWLLSFNMDHDAPKIFERTRLYRESAFEFMFSSGTDYRKFRSKGNKLIVYTGGADPVLKTLEGCDGLRRPDRFADFLLACEADARGRQGLEDRGYPQRAYFAAARDAAASIVLTPEERTGLSGEQIGQELRKRRVAAIETVKAAAAGSV